MREWDELICKDNEKEKFHSELYPKESKIQSHYFFLSEIRVHQRWKEWRWVNTYKQREYQENTWRKNRNVEEIHAVLTFWSPPWNLENMLYFLLYLCVNKGQFYCNHIDVERETVPTVEPWRPEKSPITAIPVWMQLKDDLSLFLNLSPRKPLLWVIIFSRFPQSNYPPPLILFGAWSQVMDFLLRL